MISGPPDFPQIQLLFLLNYLVTLFLLTLRWKKAIYVFNKATVIWLLIGISVVSILWSFTPAITRMRSLALVGSSLFGLYLASRYSIKEQLKLLMWTFGTVLTLSLLFAVALPKYGIMGGIHAGAWRGIYVHKNIFGKMMVLSALIFWLQASSTKQKRWFPWLGLGLSVCFLLLAKSTTSLINIVTLFTLIPIYQTLRWRYHLMIPAVIAIVTFSSSLSLWITSNAATLLGTLGKDTTLTGRTDMWPYIWEMIEKQPWLGYGYSGFWQGWNSPAAYVWRAVQWSAPNSHNGLLDLWLELGALGVAVFLLGFWATFIRSLAWLRQTKSSEGFWPLLYLTNMVMANLGESSLLNHNDIFWVLYVAVALSLFILPQQQAKILTRMPASKITA
ncbi:O-antigen ligase family protein [Calothrix sp. NIES-2098]|uniref:O-antigen ligase family protein n=1 Tax=Calothrix sp. NIES-2098 TaxID=1954171 RepID=UPI0030DDA9B6